MCVAIECVVTSCTWHQHHTQTHYLTASNQRKSQSHTEREYVLRPILKTIYIYIFINLYAVLYSHNTFCIRVFGVAFCRFAYVECSNRTIHQSHCVCQPRNIHSECYMITLQMSSSLNGKHITAHTHTTPNTPQQFPLYALR